MKLNPVLCALLQQASCAVLSTKHDSFPSGRNLARRAGPPSCLVHRSSVPPGANELEARGIDGASCGQAGEQMQQAYAQCAERARSGAEAAQNGSSTELLEAVFRTSDPEAARRVAAHLSQLAQECGQNGSGNTPVSCFGPPCEPGLAGVTLVSPDTQPGQNPITMCDLTETDGSCGGQDEGDVLLHEMSHSWGQTKDNGYGMQNIQNLDPESSLDNADSYARFAKAVHLGCRAEEILAAGQGPPAINGPGPSNPNTGPGRRPGNPQFPPGFNNGPPSQGRPGFDGPGPSNPSTGPGQRPGNPQFPPGFINGPPPQGRPGFDGPGPSNPNTGPGQRPGNPQFPPGFINGPPSQGRPGFDGPGPSNPNTGNPQFPPEFINEPPSPDFDNQLSSPDFNNDFLPPDFNNDFLPPDSDN